MKNNPQSHNRRSIRLKEYDYSQGGLYFITICVKDRICAFGEISDGKMILNTEGTIADDCWSEIPSHFPNAILHEYIVMPNHLHGIIELIQKIVGASHVMPKKDVPDSTGWASHVMPLHNELEQNKNHFSQPIPGSISVIVQQFKSSVTRHCKKINIQNFQWQSRFYDHIIRTGKDYGHISDYIMNNPSNWDKDTFRTVKV